MSCSQPGEGQLKQDNQNYEGKYKEAEISKHKLCKHELCSISEHEPYLDIDYEELNNIDMVESDDKEGGNKLNLESNSNKSHVAATSIGDFQIFLDFQ